ncbi:MAG: cation transporter [Ferruginibacter sp.]|nr:cation transporter [Ferruginibacter sp.]
MSCGGCISSVKNALLKLPDVEDAEVYLHPQTVNIVLLTILK